MIINNSSDWKKISNFARGTTSKTPKPWFDSPIIGNFGDFYYCQKTNGLFSVEHTNVAPTNLKRDLSWEESGTVVKIKPVWRRDLLWRGGWGLSVKTNFTNKFTQATKNYLNLWIICRQTTKSHKLAKKIFPGDVGPSPSQRHPIPKNTYTDVSLFQ